MQLKEKERIAREVAANIPDGSSLFIDIGTTTEAIARALLDHRELRVVTNNLNVASILTAKDDFTVIIAGGEIRNRDGGIVGEATRDFIGQFRMDYGVIGISGIDSDGSLLDFDYHEVKIAQAIIAPPARCSWPPTTPSLAATPWSTSATSTRSTPCSRIRSRRRS